MASSGENVSIAPCVLLFVPAETFQGSPSCDNVGLGIADAMALSAGRMVFARAVVMELKDAEALSITSIEFEVQLYSIADAVIVQGEVVLERTFTLSLQHDLVRLTTNTCCYHSFECFCRRS